MATPTLYSYETTVIVNAALEDPQIEAVNARVQEVITKSGGAITALNLWGRKRLLYPIKKKNTGYYLNIEFDAPGEIVKQLEHSYLLEEQIIRFLTIRLDKKALKAREIALAQRAAVPAEPVAEVAPVVIEPKPVEKIVAVGEKPVDKVPLFDEEA
ncbi:MAG TPA: 30S ribosomal protein S6 [Bacteroidota bacterium]|nr:30S ribosomal protein S6 [Bacteroidota bacterium]